MRVELGFQLKSLHLVVQLCQFQISAAEGFQMIQHGVDVIGDGLKFISGVKFHPVGAISELNGGELGVQGCQ